MGSFFNKLKTVADPIGDLVAHVAGPNSFIAKNAGDLGLDNLGSPEVKALAAANANQNNAPAGALLAGNYAGQAPSLAAAQAGYATPSTSSFSAPAGSSDRPGSASNGNLWSTPTFNAAPGGTNFFAAPGAAAAATPQAYVAQAGRTMAAQPQAQGANLNTNTWSG